MTDKDHLQSLLADVRTENVELRLRVMQLESLVRHMANTLHTHYHPEEDCGWQECTRPLCVEARKVLG